MPNINLKSKKHIAFIGVILFLIASIFWQFYQWNKVNTELLHLQEELIELKKQNQELQVEKEKLQDPKAVEARAREELGLVKPGEVPYVK